MKTLLWSLALIVFFTVTACKKSEVAPAENDPTVTFSYSSLMTEEDTIMGGEDIQIVAIATGNNLTYHWEAPIGILTGSGREVTFYACCSGDHWITCTVKDSQGNSGTKTINIHAL
jgi:hypothetical protein